MATLLTSLASQVVKPTLVSSNRMFQSSRLSYCQRPMAIFLEFQPDSAQCQLKWRRSLTAVVNCGWAELCKFCLAWSKRHRSCSFNQLLFNFVKVEQVRRHIFQHWRHCRRPRVNYHLLLAFLCSHGKLPLGPAVCQIKLPASNSNLPIQFSRACFTSHSEASSSQSMNWAFTVARHGAPELSLVQTVAVNRLNSSWTLPAFKDSTLEL